MSSPESEREQLILAVVLATARLASARIAHTERLATRLGIATTDVEVLRHLAAGPLTVGRIAESTGLSTGATTRMIDRLEQATFVRRVPDPGDRRRVIVELGSERGDVVSRADEPLDLAARERLETLDDATLAAMRDYLDACSAIYRSDPLATSNATAPPDHGAEPVADVAARLGSATAGRLVFVTGAPTVTIRGATDLGTELYRARFSGAVPSARVRDGVVTIRYPRFAWFDWRMRVAGQRVDASAHWKRDATELVLNAAIPWSVELRGGATAVDADLRPIRLTRLQLGGGAGKVSAVLGAPEGVVPVRVAGGAADVTIVRPAGTPAVLRIEGGYHEASLDGSPAWSPGRIATPGAESAADRYEIEIRGGADHVVVRGA